MATVRLEHKAEHPRCDELRQWARNSARKHDQCYQEYAEVAREVNRLRAERDDLERRLRGLAMLVSEAEREDAADVDDRAARAGRRGGRSRGLSTRLAIAVARLVGGLAGVVTLATLDQPMSAMESNVRERRSAVRDAERRMKEASDRVTAEIEYRDGVISDLRALGSRAHG